ncbi:MAG: DsbA family protein, partial [Candidatus Methylomirabilales bacterium]
LRPEPAPLLDPRGEYLTRVWSQAVYPMAEARGMTLQLPPVQPRSRKALEAAEFAREQGKFDEFHLACFRAFFEEGRDIGDPEVLLALGEEVGLARDALQQALATDQYTPKVLADQAEAARLGITGVPTYIVGERHVVVGAQPYEVLREVTDRALHERQ